MAASLLWRFLAVVVGVRAQGPDGQMLKTHSMLYAVPGNPQVPDRERARANEPGGSQRHVGEAWNTTASAAPHLHAANASNFTIGDHTRVASAAAGAGGCHNGSADICGRLASPQIAEDSLCALQLLSETSRSAPAFNWTLRWLEASFARPATSAPCGLLPLAEAAAHRGCSQLAAAAHAHTLSSLLAFVSGPRAASLAALASALTAGARGEWAPGPCGSVPALALLRILAPAPPASSADVLGHTLLSVARVALAEGRPGASRAALELVAALPGTGDCVQLGTAFETRMLSAVRKAPTGPACAWCWGGSAGPGLLARVWDERQGALSVGGGGCGGAEAVWAGMWAALSASARGEASSAASAAASAHTAVVAALGASHEASLGSAYGAAVLAVRGGGAALVALRASLGGAPSPLLRTLTLLASAALLPTERRARYAASAGGEGVALPRGHIVRAVALGEAARAQEAAARAHLLAASCPSKGGPSPSRLVCSEAAAAAAIRSPAPTPLVEAYRAAAAEWAAVPHPLRTASAPFEAFSAAHALASFRNSSAHGSLTWLEAGLLTAVAGEGGEGTGTTVIPLGGAVVYGAAVALSAAGAHAHAAAAFAAALASPAAWDAGTRAALGGGWELAVEAWTAAGGNPSLVEAARSAHDAVVGAGRKRVGGLAKLNVITAAEEEGRGGKGLWGWATGLLAPTASFTHPPPSPSPTLAANPPAPARPPTTPAPPPPTAPSPSASASDMYLSVRLSEAFLRFGMAVYGCTVATDMGKTVKCAPRAHALAPPRLAALFDPRGLEAPSSTNMLTPAGLAYLHKLLADVQAIEASGRGWELDIARTERDAAAYPYASIGMLIPVSVAPRAKGGAGPRLK